MNTAFTVLAGKRERYELVRRLGEGGFGVTHLAKRLRDGQQVVVKQLRMDRLDDWKAFDLFEREAAVLERLRHPNIPAFIDHFELKEGDALRGFALVQEYVPGRTLREVQRERPPRGALALRGWLSKLLEVCRYLHERKPPVIHRDITPKNVIVRGDGEPVLIDFGTVQNALRSAETISSTSAGTFGYAAPEQLIGRAVPASDLYGLAMTYLAVATGREPETLPFSGNRVQVSEALRDHDTHPRLVLLLEEMVDPESARRPASAAEVLGRLASIPAVAAQTTSVALAPVHDDETPGARVERQWRERAARSTRLGTTRRKPEPAPKTEDIGNCVIDETGRWARFESGFKEGIALSIDLEVLSCSSFASAGELEVFHPDIAFDLDGQSAMLTSFGSGALVVETSGGEKRVCRFQDLVDSQFSMRGDPGSYAISPDRTLFAFTKEHAFVIADVASGTIAQRIAPSDGLGRFASFGGSVRFSPDSSCIIYESTGDTRIVDSKGKVEVFGNTSFACGHDGRTAARASESAVEVGVIESWAPFSWREGPRRLWVPGESVRHLRFSPDDRRLAVGLASGRVVVLDAQSGDVILRAEDPYRPGLPFDRISQVGFASDGRRLLVVGRCTLYPLATERDVCIAVFSLTRHKALGTLQLAKVTDDSQHHFSGGGLERDLYGFTTLGPHARLKPKGKRAKQVRALLLDESPEEVLGPKTGEAFDFEDRIAFWGGPLEDRRMPSAQDLTPLVEASAGLTHLLPLALERAVSAAQNAPARIGQATGDGATLPIPPLLEQLEWLATKNPAEREVLFEDMLPGVVAKEVRKLVEDVAKTGAGRRSPLLLAMVIVIGVVLVCLVRIVVGL